MHWHGHELRAGMLRSSAGDRAHRTPETVLDNPNEALEWLEKRLRAAAGVTAQSDWSDSLELWQGLLGAGQSLACGTREVTVALDVVEECECRRPAAVRTKRSR